MLLLLRFFYVFLRFFENPKKRDFLRFFALLHTFSRTMLLSEERIKLRTSNVVGTFIGSIGTKAHLKFRANEC